MSSSTIASHGAGAYGMHARNQYFNDQSALTYQNSDDFNMIGIAASSGGFNAQNTTSQTFSLGNVSLQNTGRLYGTVFQEEIYSGENGIGNGDGEGVVDSYDAIQDNNNPDNNYYDEHEQEESKCYNDEGEEDDQEGDALSELSEIMDERQFIRISTAPPRPLTDLEEFKRSYQFLLLEQAIVTSQKLVQKDYQKFDLDSPDGAKVFRKFLTIIERLIKAFDCVTASRDYRDRFSKAYKILYQNGELCYLTEILDSAQEGFPYLYVNGEKYTFSQEVLQAGQNLQNSFFKLQHIMRNAYSRTCSENVVVSSVYIKLEISNSLEKFDLAWAKFEMYVMELMGIETEARRYVQCAIHIDQKMSAIEVREKSRGKFFVQSEEYVALRSKMCKYIAAMNAIANADGKGRDDLEYEILAQAEGILRRITNEQSHAVRVLAEDIKNAYDALRVLFQKYSENIEMVDPQLKNNPDLVSALTAYETTWEKGKNYFLDGRKSGQLIHFSHIIETTTKKYGSFQEQLECRDADIFLSIPCLLVLKHLDNDDKNICAYFLPQMFEEKNKLFAIYKELQEEFAAYKTLKKASYRYYNTLERLLLNVETISQAEANEPFGASQSANQFTIGKIIHKTKLLAMEMSRNNPVEWNSFLDVVLQS